MCSPGRFPGLPDAAGASGGVYARACHDRRHADHRIHRVVGLPATRVYLSEQFPTALRGRGHIFGESFARLFAGGLAPFLMEPYTGSATIFFGTILLVAAIGAVVRSCSARRRSARSR